MLLFLVNPTMKDLFRVLHRIKGKKEGLEVLFLDGGNDYASGGLVIRRSGYFSLLRAGKKTLKDLILEGAFREYSFSRVIRRAFFVPKLRGDMLYYAYLSRGWGEEVYVEGIEEFEAKARELKEREGFVDYWDVEEIKVSEPVIVLFRADQYRPVMLAPFFNLLRKDRKKTLILVLRHSSQELKSYFSLCGHSMEEVVFYQHDSFQNPDFSFQTRQEFLKNLPEKTLICEWDRKNLFEWAIKLSDMDIPFGVPGDYRGEKILLSTPYSVWGIWDVGFFGTSAKAHKLPYLKAFTHAKKIILALEDLLLWGAMQIN